MPSPKQILTTPKLSQCVTGPIHDRLHNSCTKNAHESASSATSIGAFIRNLHRSLVEIVVQSVENTTRDVREMQRLLRLLWPLYLDPLLESHSPLLESLKPASSCTDPLVQEFSSVLRVGTITTQRVLLEQTSKINRLLGKLGGLVRPHVIKLLSSNILCPSQGGYYGGNTNAANLSFSKRLPYLTKFVLLAAYLCQKNKAAKDQMLHTGKKSGQRRKNEIDTRTTTLKEWRSRRRRRRSRS